MNHSRTSHCGESLTWNSCFPFFEQGSSLANILETLTSWWPLVFALLFLLSSVQPYGQGAFSPTLSFTALSDWCHTSAPAKVVSLGSLTWAPPTEGDSLLLDMLVLHPL